MRLKVISALFALAIAGASSAQAQFSAADCEPLTGAARARALAEHMYGGPPSGGDPLVRRAYVTEYDSAHRVPRWTAWRVIPPYRATPTRKGIWAAFRRDTDVPNPVVTGDYTRMRISQGALHRGHIAPYFIAGGDRDGDDLLAARPSDGVTGSDLHDACTVFEINLMTNIAPQLARFNGSGGLWYELESNIRDLVDAGHEIHVIAGTLFASNPNRRGPDHDIGVPDMFYQIVVTENGVVPFLFIHRRRLPNANGCLRTAPSLTACITTVSHIERLSRLNFFAALPNESELERANGDEVWATLWEEEE